MACDQWLVVSEEDWTREEWKEGKNGRLQGWKRKNPVEDECMERRQTVEGKYRSLDSVNERCRAKQVSIS